MIAESLLSKSYTINIYSGGKKRLLQTKSKLKLKVYFVAKHEKERKSGGARGERSENGTVSWKVSGNFAVKEIQPLFQELGIVTSWRSFCSACWGHSHQIQQRFCSFLRLAMNVLKNSTNWQRDLELVQLTRKRYRNAKSLGPHMDVFGNCRISINYLFERLMSCDGKKKGKLRRKKLAKTVRASFN